LTWHALTIDLEDWHQDMVHRLTGNHVEPSAALVSNTERLLDVLDEVGIKATFFVLGMAADARPDLVRSVAARGHEIACHSQNHQLVRTMSRNAFLAEIEGAAKRLQDLVGKPVLGFRAPEFSVGSLDHWCFEVLLELGFTYDSSVVPASRGRYSIPAAPQGPFFITTKNGPLREFPLATYQMGSHRLAVGGGTYFRVFPGSVLRRAVRDLDGRGQTAVLYFHPYEFHRGWLHSPGLPPAAVVKRDNIKYTILHNLVTGWIEKRLRPILREFAFKPLAEIAAAMTI
jgi:polysaccharide deacetylase family protein (PEP-CTERM system associated)